MPKYRNKKMGWRKASFDLNNLLHGHLLTRIHSPFLSAVAAFLATIRVIAISHSLHAGSFPCLTASISSLIWASSDSSCFTSELILFVSAAAVTLLESAAPRSAIAPNMIWSCFMACTVGDWWFVVGIVSRYIIRKRSSVHVNGLNFPSGMESVSDCIVFTNGVTILQKQSDRVSFFVFAPGHKRWTQPTGNPLRIHMMNRGSTPGGLWDSPAINNVYFLPLQEATRA